MPDETTTARSRILAAIRHHWELQDEDPNEGAEELAAAIDEALFGQPTDHSTPWRVGTKGLQTIYDASPIGDGGQPGRSLGRMDTPELAARVVGAVNRLAELEAEVRRLPLAIADGEVIGHETTVEPLRAENVPLIAALLRGERA